MRNQRAITWQNGGDLAWTREPIANAAPLITFAEASAADPTLGTRVNGMKFGRLWYLRGREYAVEPFERAHDEARRKRRREAERTSLIRDSVEEAAAVPVLRPRGQLGARAGAA